MQHCSNHHCLPLFILPGQKMSLSAEHLPHNTRAAFAFFKGWQCHLHNFNEYFLGGKRTVDTCRSKLALFKSPFSLITDNIGPGLQTKHCYIDNQEVWHLCHRGIVFFGGKMCTGDGISSPAKWMTWIVRNIQSGFVSLGGADNNRLPRLVYYCWKHKAHRPVVFWLKQ